MHRRWILVGGLFVLVLAAGCIDGGTLDGSEPEAESYTATVTAVVDGDTIDVRLANGTEERVRLLGIDTPEIHVDPRPEHFEGVPDTAEGRACLEAAGQNASRFVGERIAGERVTIEFDPTADRRGGYDRLLAYVVHENRTLNYFLVARGHAGIYPTEFAHRDHYEAAVADARAADQGLWQCRDP